MTVALLGLERNLNQYYNSQRDAIKNPKYFNFIGDFYAR